ncbi:MAG: tRNA-binding protein [Saprospiraceae bacterium]|nr:tRNA-binding protein [Saprospiraceae bacterium]
MDTITFSDFQRVEMRVGTILEVREFPNARHPAWQLRIDFGPEIGEKRSSAQITRLYAETDLVGRQVIAVVNFPVKQIANFFSEVLVLGLDQPDAGIVLLQTERPVENGLRVS